MSKKNKLRNRMTPARRNALGAELARYKSGPPITALAKDYLVSTSTVNHHWLAVKKARKAKVVTPAVPEAEVRSLKSYNPRIMGQLAQGAGATLMVSGNGSALSPSIKAMVDSALEKELLTLRKRIEEYVNEAMRK